MIKVERGNLEIVGKGSEICAEIEIILSAIREDIGEKNFEIVLDKILKNVRNKRIHNENKTSINLSRTLNEMNKILDEILNNLN